MTKKDNNTGDTESNGTERCGGCGSEIVAFVRMNNYTVVSDYTTTEYTREYYCDRQCLEQSLSAGTNQEE